MEKRNYTHVQVLLPEINAMLDAGKAREDKLLRVFLPSTGRK